MTSPSSSAKEADELGVRIGYRQRVPVLKLEVAKAFIFHVSKTKLPSTELPLASAEITKCCRMWRK